MPKCLKPEYFSVMTHRKANEKYDIFVVEDDQDIRYYLGLIFSNEGFRCLMAENGQKALEMVSELPHHSTPKIAFVDVMMPVLDGPGFVQALNSQNICQGMEVIFATSSLAQPKVYHHDKLCRVMTKPYDTEEILKIARRHCQPYQSTQSSFIET